VSGLVEPVRRYCPRHGGRASPRASCEDCRRVGLRYDKWRQRQSEAGHPLTVPSLGTARRLRALTAMGWRASDLAAALGMSERSMANIRSGLRPTVRRATAVATHRFYTLYASTPGPSSESRRRAKLNGWPLPSAWTDIDNPDAVPTGRPAMRECEHCGSTIAMRARDSAARYLARRYCSISCAAKVSNHRRSQTGDPQLGPIVPQDIDA